MPCYATCGAAFHFVLSSPYLPVSSYAPVSIRSLSLLILLYTSLFVSFAPVTTSLSPLSLSPTLARTILSIFRHRLLEKILRIFCHCFHYLLFFLLLPLFFDV